MKNSPPHPPPRVMVVGSLNLDLIARVRSLPAPGETVSAGTLLRRFGGKGANQAVAAARQGAAVALIGCVGADPGGHAYREHLRHEFGITAETILAVPHAPTGTALIAVDDAGENHIIVASGANARTSAAVVHRMARWLRSAQAVLVQLEIPLPAVLTALDLSAKAGVPAILNPSPLAADFPWGRIPIHTVIVNALEAEHIFRARPGGLVKGAGRWREKMRQYRITQLVITRGAQPTLVVTSDSAFAVPGLVVRPVDTVGAGDAFAGTFATCMAEGRPLEESVLIANCAGALATLKPGAQEAIPTRIATLRAARKMRQKPLQRPGHPVRARHPRGPVSKRGGTAELPHV